MDSVRLWFRIRSKAHITLKMIFLTLIPLIGYMDFCIVSLILGKIKPFLFLLNLLF